NHSVNFLLPLSSAKTRDHPRYPLFPYTTLFRSLRVAHTLRLDARAARRGERACVGRRMGALARAAQRRYRKRVPARIRYRRWARSEEHTSELQSPYDLVCRLLLEKKNVNVVLR